MRGLRLGMQPKPAQHVSCNPAGITALPAACCPAAHTTAGRGVPPQAHLCWWVGAILRCSVFLTKSQTRFDPERANMQQSAAHAATPR